MLWEALGASLVPVTWRKSCGLSYSRHTALHSQSCPWVLGGEKTITSSHSACNQELGLAGHMALASRAGSGRLAWHWDLQPHVVRFMQGRDQRPSSAGDPETPGRWLVRAQDPRKNMLPPSGIFPCLQGLGRDGTKSQSESQGLPVSLRPRLWVSGHGLH